MRACDGEKGVWLRIKVEKAGFLVKGQFGAASLLCRSRQDKEEGTGRGFPSLLAGRKRGGICEEGGRIRGESGCANYVAMLLCE